MRNFSQILGNENIKEHFQNAILLNQISHAYILNGEAGSGKKSIAGLFAKTLQCEQHQINPCNKCRSCKQADSHNQPDIKWIVHEKPGSIGVEDIREQLIGDICIKPYSSKYKIYIIDEAEKLTIQAQNALLKTIEEPPEYGIVVLLTENSGILMDTVISRCVLLNMKPVSDSVIEEYLIQNYQITDYEAKFAVSFAQGSVGQAVRIVRSKEFEEMRKHALHLLKNIYDMSVVELIESVKETGGYKVNIKEYIDLLTMWYRDILIFKSTNDSNLVIYKEQLSVIKKQAETISYEGIDKILKAMDKAKIRLKANVNFDLAIELMFLCIKENIK